MQPFASPSELCKQSPLLFWTIILIASREHHRFVTLSHRVATHHGDLLSPILQRTIQQIETIHALLLLCLWPVPRPHYFQNPAWNYVGLATHAAMQLQCHTALEPVHEQYQWPGFNLVVEGRVTAIEKAQTWLGCVRAGTV